MSTFNHNDKFFITSGGDVEIHNEGNDTTGKLTLSGNNNTGTPGQKTSATIEHRGAHLKTFITHNGTDVITIGTGTQVQFAGDVTALGYLQTHGELYLRGNIRLLNKAANGWLYFATRNTSASEAVYNLANIGTISTSGSATFGGQVTIPATPVANTDAASKGYVDSQVGSNDTLSEILANGNTTGGTDIAVSAGDDITFTSTSKAIFNGVLEIYHDATDNYIADTGTGDLRILTDRLVINNAADTKNMIRATENAGVELFYNAVERLETTSVGVRIDGDLTHVNNQRQNIVSSGTAASYQYLDTRDYMVNKGDYATSTWIVAPNYSASIHRVTAFEDNTNVYIDDVYHATINKMSNSSIAAADVSNFTKITADKPIIVHVNDPESMPINTALSSTKLGAFTNRYHPTTMYMYSPFGKTDVKIYESTSAPVDISGTPTYTTTIAEGAGVTETLTNHGDTTDRYYVVVSELPICGSYAGNTTSGDYMLLAPVGMEILGTAYAADNYWGFNDGTTSSSVNIKTGDTSAKFLYDATGKNGVFAASTADGAGGDAEFCLPLEYLSDTYIYVHDTITNFRLASYKSNTIKVLDKDDNVLYTIDHTSATKEVPQYHQEGDAAGNGADLSTAGPFKFVGSSPFYLVCQEGSEDAETVMLGALQSSLANHQSFDGGKVPNDIEIVGNIDLADGAARSIIGPTNEDLIINSKPNGDTEGLFLQINGSDKLSIVKNGYVGMGIDPTSNQRLTLAEADSNGSHIKMNNSRSGGGYWVNGVGDSGSSSSITPAGGIFWYNGTTKMVIDSSGNVGIGDAAPFSKLQVGSNTFSGGNGMYADARVGISNHGQLTGMMLASTYNDASYPEYGLVFVQGPTTSSYNVWSISPDGPAKGSDLNFIYQAQSTNIHVASPMLKLHGSTSNATFAGDVFTPGLYVNATSAVSGTQVAIVQDGAQNLQRWGSTSDGTNQASFRFRIDQNFKFIGNSGSGDKITIDSATGNITATGGTIQMSLANMSSYQLNGTYVMDSSRNLVNIGAITASGNLVANSLTSHNTRISTSQEFPVGHYTGGKEIWSIDPTWSEAQLQDYFGSSNVSWNEDSTAPAGYAIYIDGAVNVGGPYNSGFPYIPIETGAIYYMECYIRNAGTNQAHYMGSVDYKEDFSAPSTGSGNPGSYGYFVMLNTNPGTSWTKVHGIIRGNDANTVGYFENGAKYWTPQALFNYVAGSGTRACYISGWKVVKISSAEYYADGSASAPSISFAEDKNTGIYRSASDTMNFSTGGTNALTIGNNNATFTGSVTLSSTNFIELTVDQTDSARARVGVSSGSTEAFLMADNLGAGHVAGNTSVKLMGYDSSTLEQFGKFHASGLDVRGDVDATGNVDATNFRDRDDTSYSLTPSSGATGYWQVNTPSGYVRIGAQNASYAHFYTDRGKYYFNKEITVDTGVIQSYNEDLKLRRLESNTDYIQIRDTSIGFFLDTAEDMRLENDGDLHVEGDVIAYSTTISDNKLKDHVITIDSALDKVSKLRGVEYTWNATSRKGQKDIGVIAQEVEEVIPEIVREKEMSLIDGGKYKTVDYEKLTAVLIEAVKELKEEVEELKNKCNDCTK